MLRIPHMTQSCLNITFHSRDSPLVTLYVSELELFYWILEGDNQKILKPSRLFSFDEQNYLSIIKMSMFRELKCYVKYLMRMWVETIGSTRGVS